MSLLLKNALLVEPDLKKVVEGNLVIRNGLIDRKDFAADNEIDCTGKFRYPLQNLYDRSVHFKLLNCLPLLSLSLAQLKERFLAVGS